MVDEKNPILNPQAEGSNTASGSSSFNTEIEEELERGEDMLIYDYDSEEDYTSDEEINKKFKELAKVSDELKKRKTEEKILHQKVSNFKERVAKTNDQKELQKLEIERLEILREHGELVKLFERKIELNKEVSFGSDSEDESENEEENSQDKGKGKELTTEQELAKLETSLVSWINEEKEQGKAKIETGGVSKGGAAFVGTYVGVSAGLGSGAAAGAAIGSVVLPGIGTVGGAAIGTIVGIFTGTAAGAGTAALIINSDEKTIRAQTKKQLEDIVLALTKREQEEKNNLISYLTIVKEKMDGQKEEIEKIKSEKAGLTRQLNKAEAKATAAEKELREKAKEDAEEKERIDKEKGEIQKALLSAEKSEIEQLKSERNQLRASSEEQEAFLNRWIREYNRLDLEKKNTILAMEELFLKFKQRGRENGELTIKNARLETSIVGLQGNIKTQKIEIRNLTNSRDTARNERDTAREELGKLKLEKIQWAYDKKKLEEAKDEAERTMKSLGYPKWFKKTTDFLGVESANQIWGKGVFLGRFALLILVGAFLSYVGSWILRLLVGIFKNLKAIFTKKQNTAEVLKEMLTGMKEAKDSVIKKVKRVKKQPVEEVKEVEVIEEISDEKKAPSIAEKTESENQQKNGSKKKKKNRIKRK